MFGNRMSRIAARCALALVVVAATAACQGGQPRRANAQNNNVLFIGDSIFALSFDIEENLEAAFNTTFRSYTASGAQLSTGGFATPVTTQFTNAERANPNSTIVVMNGGGNDILIPAIMGNTTCLAAAASPNALPAACNTRINQISVTLTNFLNRMAAAGVTEVIYLGYYRVQSGSLSQQLNRLGPAVDASAMALSIGCANVTRPNFRCTFVDTRQTIDRRTIAAGNTDILRDGVHPTPAGSRKLSDLIRPVLDGLI
jgi:hypothetical protein